MGKGDLAAYVAKLTKLPVDVAITPVIGITSAGGPV